MPEENQNLSQEVALTKGLSLETRSNEDIQAHQIKHNHLLVIGVDYYEANSAPHGKRISNLNNCIRDIEALINVLTKYYHFSKSNIHFLRSRQYYEEKYNPEYSAQELKVIAGKEQKELGYAYVGEATHENIISRLKFFTKKKNIGPKDNLIIFFSGHGIYDEDFNEGYWIPRDAILDHNSTYIENGTIRTALDAIESHHTVLFSDSCYSGTLFSTMQSRALKVPRVYNHASRWGITAGRKEPVLDGALGENSPFAKELLHILNKRQEIWISDLINQIIKNIEKENEKQTPVGEALSFLKGHQNGQFVFLPTEATELDYWRIAWRENTKKAYYEFLARFDGQEYEPIALEALKLLTEKKDPHFSEEGLHMIKEEYLPSLEGPR